MLGIHRFYFSALYQCFVSVLLRATDKADGETEKAVFSDCNKGVLAMYVILGCIESGVRF